MGKAVDGKQAIHLLNFISATTLQWRDNNGTQAYPRKLNQIPLSVSTDRQVAKVWFASPDVIGGASISLPVTRSANHVSFTIPSLEYWDMIVVEYQ